VSVGWRRVDRCVVRSSGTARSSTRRTLPCCRSSASQPPAASTRLVAADPVATAKAAATFLRERGLFADVGLAAEPELAIAFVVTDAFTGTVCDFRKHVRHLPRPTTVRD